MSRRVARRVAWSLWLLDVGVLVVLVPGGGGSGDLGTVGGALFILAFATTGALVASRIPTNPVGWLLCVSALAFALGGVSVATSEYATREGAGGAVVTAASWVGTFVWMLGIGPAATYVLLLFPDGRLPSRRWRPVAWLSGVSLAAITLSIALRPGPFADIGVVNPLGVEAGEGALTVLEAAGMALLLVCVLASCASLVVRYRGAGAQQRQQLKWLAWSLPVVLAWLATSIGVESRLSGDAASDVANLLASVGLTIVPVAIAVAILRHRLYDIDLVIKRTLVYGSLTAMLLGTYLGSVLLLRLMFSPWTGESDLAVAASTLAVAALFRPLRARVQASVDRRFDRARYDAARTVAAFTATLRNELDLEALATDLRGVVKDTLAPSQVTLWLRSAP